MSSRRSILLLRGPLALVGVSVSALWPHISTWSTQTIVQILISSIGIIWLITDLLKFTESRMRRAVAKLVDNFILDDFLRILYDPDTGIIPCTVGSFLGASSMYCLRMNEEQRTKLVQASLWTTNEEAHSILLDAGGTRALLPESVRDWIDRSRRQEQGLPDSKPQASSVETVEEASSESSSLSGCHNHSVVYKPTAMNERASSDDDIERLTAGTSKVCDDWNKPEELYFENSATKIPQRIPTDTSRVMFSIVMDMMTEKFRPMLASIPEAKLEIVGAMATMGLCAQFLLRLRSRQWIIGSISAMCLSGTAMGAFSMMLIRHACLGAVQDVDSLKEVSIAILLRSFGRIKHLVTKDKRLKGAIAMIVLSLLGRLKPQQPTQRYQVVP